MSKISSYVLDLLNHDIVDHGFFVQCVEESEAECGERKPAWTDLLEELIGNGVEIGTARKKSEDYVEFIAWKGTVSERISRAIERVATADAANRAYAYWLCLRKNVDRYEE